MGWGFGFGGGFWDFRGGGYLGIGMGGEGVGVRAETGSWGGGVEGKEEKRFLPGSEDDNATITIDVGRNELCLCVFSDELWNR